MLHRSSTLATLTLLAGTAMAAPQLNAPQSLATATRPGGAAAGDFNGDSFPDLAVAVDTVDRIDIFMGNGDGTFAAPVSIFTGGNTGPDSLAAFDADGDGDTDLAVVLNNQNTVRLYMNGGGAFTQGNSAATGAEPVSLSAADIDGNGSIDMLTANRDANSISIILNTGGVLTSTNVPVGDEPRDAVAFNMDGAGSLEIAATNSRDRSISILTGAGGAYSIAQTLNVGAAFRPEGIAAGDIDGDGDDDLVAAVEVFAQVWTNTAGSFASTNVSAGFETDRIMLADLDGDGDLDAVTANQDANALSVFDNTGAGLAAGIAVAAGTAPDRLASADFDLNGSADLAVTNRDSNNTFIYLTTGTVILPCNGADLAAPFGVLNVEDIETFVQLFVAGDLGGDLTGDGNLNVDDVDAFIAAFLSGCP